MIFPKRLGVLLGLGVCFFTAIWTLVAQMRGHNELSSRPRFIIVHAPYALEHISAVIHMCDEAGADCIVSSDWGLVARWTSSPMVQGCQIANHMTMPFLLDGDFSISQSTAMTMYAGKKLGFDVPADIESQVQANQYMADAADFAGGLQTMLMGYGRTKDWTQLQAYMDTGRHYAYLGVIEKSIKGPFYFGENPTYVDFYTAMHVEQYADAWPPVATALLRYPKVDGLVKALQALPSYSNHGMINWNTSLAKVGWPYPVMNCA